jgi:nucleoid DNA-binding protein
MNITKLDIVEKIAKATGISKVDTKAVVDGVITSVIEAVVEGKKIELRGFGVFNFKKRRPRQARNPRTGEVVELGERHVPIFKPSADFTNKVNHNLSNKK